MIMAMIAELAQWILTKRPTVPRASEGAIWPAANRPTRACEPRTEMMRPNDAVGLKSVIVYFTYGMANFRDYATWGLNKQLRHQGIIVGWFVLTDGTHRQFR